MPDGSDGSDGYDGSDGPAGSQGPDSSGGTRSDHGPGPTPTAGFHLQTDLTPKGDQPRAIEKLVEGLDAGKRDQVLLGVTGSGKTFTIANVIERVGRPTLVISHNKTLAAQLYEELSAVFPDNAVEYFVSYYDYYQPEAYVPQSDTYIEKDAGINEEIERMRHRATEALMTRRDVVVVASVSCIFGLGSPSTYEAMTLQLHVGDRPGRKVLLSDLVELQYERTDDYPGPGTFRTRGDVLEVFPPGRDEVLRISLFGDEVESVEVLDPVSREVTDTLPGAVVYPATHYISEPTDRDDVLAAIEAELAERLRELRRAGKELQAQRLEQRTRYDLEMLAETGHCTGIENYARHFDGRDPGEPPYTLLDYFPDDYLTVVDESHVTIPQIRGMYRGDRTRKETLIDHGFRLPSALDNRPLRFAEWRERAGQVVHMSATPGPWELERTGGDVVEQIVRPTGLVDPPVEVRPEEGQVDDLIAEVRGRAEKRERTLITTLTKRMAEDLTQYLQGAGVKVAYLHSDIDTLDRVEVLEALREGKIDCLVGVNLLREGLDLPEVSLVAILDADREGFLRNKRSIIQTAGRAARNINGEVILYARQVTDSMAAAMEETGRRREKQLAYNEEHGIEPKSIQKELRRMRKKPPTVDFEGMEERLPKDKFVQLLRDMMQRAADDLQFERAAEIRDKLREIEGRGGGRAGGLAQARTR